MTLTRRLLAVPLLLMLTPSFSRGAEIRDGARLFSAGLDVSEASQFA